MKLYVEKHIKSITVKELESAYKYDEVLAYCTECNNYSRNYSCPDLPINGKEFLNNYEYATLILTEVKTDYLKENLNEFSNKDLESQAQKLHMTKENDTGYNLVDSLAMKTFNVVKDIMTEELLQLETEFPDSISVPPGSCTRCDTCTKIEDKPCRYPGRLRYSLEALGFLIADLYRVYFDLELEWSQGEIPKAYHTCSALLHKEKIDVDKLQELLLKVDHIFI